MFSSVLSRTDAKVSVVPVESVPMLTFYNETFPDNCILEPQNSKFWIANLSYRFHNDLASFTISRELFAFVFLPFYTGRV